MVAFERKIYNDLKYLSYAPILFISALTGQRVPKVLNMIDEVAEQTQKRISTATLNRSFRKWVERFSPPLYKNRHVKLNYITQVSTAPPTFVISTNIPEGIHFSYERFLTNQIRETFGFKGVPIYLKFRKKRGEP